MQRFGRYVVCLVVLIVVARGDAWVIGTGAAGGPVLLHVTPSFMGARLAAGRSPQLIIARSASRDHRWVDRDGSADVRGRRGLL